MPKTGLEAIWNHIMRYRGEQIHMVTNQAAVLASGSYNLLKLDRYVYFNYGREGMTPQDLNNTLFYYKYNIVAPAKLAGSALVVQETIDQVLSIRKAWRFNSGERRVRRLPSLAYDTLQPDTNGLATADTVDVYNARRITTSGNCWASARCWCHTTAMPCIRRAFPTPTSSRPRPSTPSCCATSRTASGWSRRPCARAWAIRSPSAASTWMRTAGRSSPRTSTTPTAS